MRERVVVAWSGGKDSALALYEILNSGKYEIRALLTTITRDYDRITIHGVRRALLELQAKALHIPLEEMFIPKGASNEEYESELLKALLWYRDRGVCSVMFGDIFLADVRKYREQLLAKIGMKALLPLWGKNTRELATQFINLGFKAVVTSVDSIFLSKDFVGQNYDETFLANLPTNVDPCGENGEFHSFVYDGPIFKEKIAFKKGEIVLRDNRFYYYDLIPS